MTKMSIPRELRSIADHNAAPPGDKPAPDRVQRRDHARRFAFATARVIARQPRGGKMPRACKPSSPIPPPPANDDDNGEMPELNLGEPAVAVGVALRPIVSARMVDGVFEHPNFMLGADGAAVYQSIYHMPSWVEFHRTQSLHMTNLNRAVPVTSENYDESHLSTIMFAMARIYVDVVQMSDAIQLFSRGDLSAHGVKRCIDALVPQLMADMGRLPDTFTPPLVRDGGDEHWTSEYVHHTGTALSGPLKVFVHPRVVAFLREGVHDLKVAVEALGCILSPHPGSEICENPRLFIGAHVEHVYSIIVALSVELSRTLQLIYPCVSSPQEGGARALGQVLGASGAGMAWPVPGVMAPISDAVASSAVASLASEPPHTKCACELPEPTTPAVYAHRLMRTILAIINNGVHGVCFGATTAAGLHRIRSTTSQSLILAGRLMW